MTTTPPRFSILKGNRYSESLQRGLAILQCFTSNAELLRLAEIADLVGTSRATAHRYARTLVALGFLEQPLNGGRRYRLGPKAHDIGMLALNSRRQRRIARPHLQELRSRLSYTVSLGVLDDRDVLIMDRFGGYRGHARLKMNIGVGSRWPTYCTSMGKSLLAHLSKAELDEVIGGVALEKWTPTTIRSKHALRAELKQIAAAGFAIDDQELATGTRSIAVPVRSKTGRLAGALEVAAPATMIDRAQMTKRFFPALLETSAAIAAELPDEPRFKSKRQDHSSGS